MNKIFTFAIVFLSFGLFAQQSPQSSLYNFNVYDFNPAVAGIDGTLSINGDIRRQWVGINGAPLTQSINAHLPVYFTKGGFGLTFKNFTAGVSQNIQGAFSYNQIVQINESAVLSIGASGGIAQHSFRGSELLTTDGIYDSQPISNNDGDLPDTNVSGMAPILSAGLILQYNSLRFGLSADNLLGSQFILPDAQRDVFFNQIRHYYGYVNYRMSLDNDLSLMPSILVKAEQADMQVDFNISAEYSEKFMLGVGYRGFSEISTDALIIQAGFRLNDNLIMRYAYDLGLSELRNAHSGSHEILISYDIFTEFGKGVLPQIIYNPRFL